MINVTNYSVYFLIELKNRMLYLLVSFLLNGVYILLYINDYLVHFLRPIEYLNLDFTLDMLCNYIISHMRDGIHDSEIVTPFQEVTSSVISNSEFDYYPVFEINVSDNSSIYVGFFLYLNLIYMVPLLIYHSYLFVLPGIYKHEYLFFSRCIALFYTSCYIYITSVHSLIICISVYVTYNNYYEFFNYEFDIDFNLLQYIDMNIQFLLLFYVNALLWIFCLYSERNKVKFISILFLLINSYLYTGIIFFVCNILILYLFKYCGTVIRLLY